MRAQPSLRPHLAAFMTVTLVTTPAYATPPADSPGVDQAPSEASQLDHSQKAIDAFERGDYEEAVENFELAFESDGNPNNLFNIGRVYEEAGNLEAAVDYYKRFLEQPGVPLDYRKSALERIEVLERTLAATTRGEPASEGPRDEPPTQAPAPSIERGEVDVDFARNAERRRKQRIAGYSLLGVGAAGLIAGGVLGGLTRAAARDLDGEDDPSERERLADRGRGLATGADVLYIAGGSLALVGLVVTLTALPKKNPRTAMAPSFGPHGGGLVLMHRF